MCSIGNCALVPPVGGCEVGAVCRWEEMAAKHGLTLDWQSLGGGLALPSESAEESKAPNDAPPASSATMEVVEQKLKDTKAQRRYLY